MEKTVAKAIKLLEALAAHERPQRVTELARELGIAKSNVHRLLQTLIELGHVRQNEHGLYLASIRLWEFGSQVAGRLAIQRAAGDHLKRLAAATAEESQLAMLDGTDTVYLQAIEAVHPVRVASVLGRRVSLHCTAVGKAILAYQPDAVIRATTRQLHSFTPRTITTSERLRAELAEIRRRGYAMNLGEWHAGIHGIGAPITSPDGTVGAAVSVIGPAERMQARKLRELAPKVVEAAEAIALSLAYVIARPEAPPERRLREPASAPRPPVTAG
jgi:DNA-binding IclR family transcriptional regulator